MILDWRLLVRKGVRGYHGSSVHGKEGDRLTVNPSNNAKHATTKSSRPLKWSI